MGRSAERKRKFFAEHPICAFCGRLPATTEDHVPARVMFLRREWPEGFVFPACEACNVAEKDAEQVAAFHLHSLVNGHLEEFRRAFRGLRNNYPHALPSAAMSLGKKAQALAARGIMLPAHLIAHAPVAALSPETPRHMHRFARKLMKALYYRHLGRPVPTDFRIITNWTTGDQPGAGNFLEKIAEIMPGLAVGGRQNTDLGNQFYYRYNESPEHDVFVFTAGFSHHLFFVGLGARADFGVRFEDFLKDPSWAEIA